VSGADDKSSGNGNPDVRAAFIGQAAAGLTAAAAIIYGAGALVIALRLYFTHLAWEAVLGQLPRDLILTTGFGQIVLPAMIFGLLGAIFLNFIVNAERESGYTRKLQKLLQRYLLAPPGFVKFGAWVFISAAVAAAEAGISVPFYLYHSRYYIHSGVVIPAADAFLVSAGLCAVAVGISQILLPVPVKDRVFPELYELPADEQRGAPANPSAEASASPGETADSNPGPGKPSRKAKRKERSRRAAERKLKDSPAPGTAAGWTAWVSVLIAFAAIPGIAAASAATLFPPTLACSSSFRNGYLSGNLIATNGGYAYMVEYRTTDFSHDYIAVVPLSATRLETVGQFGDCNTLTSP
jgi:hypothetical protein